MGERKVKTKMMDARALISPSSFDEEKGTVQVTFATQTPYLRDGWRIGIDTPYNEVLSCNPTSVRMDHAKNGLPLFDNHPWDKSAVNQLGKVTDIKCVNGELVGTLNFGARMDDAMKADIKSGIISALSVGYKVNSLILDESKSGEYPTYTVDDWEPFEVSLAPVPADPDSQIRSRESEITTTITDNIKCMFKIKEIEEKGTKEQKDRLSQIRYVTRKSNLTDEKIEDYFNSEKSVEAIEEEIKLSQKDDKTIDTQIEEAKKDASNAEKNRIDNLMTAAKNGGVDLAKVFGWYKEGKSDEDIYRSICSEFAKSGPKVDGSFGQGEDGKDKMIRGMETVLLHRCAPSIFKDDVKNEFRSCSIIELVKLMSQARGVNIGNLSKSQIADRILQRDMSTSDFPLLLEGLANKMLMQEYQGMPEYWTMISREIPFDDFKDKNFYRTAKPQGMVENKEGEEITYGTLKESKQKTRVKKYAEGLKLTREAIVNDDLSAFTRIPTDFVRDWNLLQGDVVWGILKTGKLADGTTAFSSDNGNLAATGAIISEDTLSAARVAMMNQVDAAKKIIRVTPRYLIVSPDLMTTAQKMLTAVMANATGSVNVFSGAFELIVEPRLTGKAWWLAADPNATDGIVHGYLNGSGLRTFREEKFDTDSINFAVRGEFGAAMLDYRGLYKNPGQ